MTLALSGLQSDLQALATSPGATIAACAQAWADAMKSYASAVVPASATVNAAATTLKTALEGAFAQPAAAPAMETAFAAFAATVGTGMAPAFVAVPPPAPVGFAALFAGTFPASHAAAATALSAKINTWMKTGTSTPSGGGSPTAWT